MTLGLLDGPALAATLGIHPGTIRNWAHTGRISRRGTDTHGRATYEIEEVCAMITPKRSGRTMPPSGSRHP